MLNVFYTFDSVAIQFIMWMFIQTDGSIIISGVSLLILVKNNVGVDKD